MTRLAPCRPGSWLSLGLSQRDEFQPLWQMLCEQTAEESWQTVATSQEFFAAKNSTPIEFAVIWQSHPDEFTATDATRLLTTLPLCRVVCVTGAWCESDQRTRRVWPPALIVPWWRAAPRLQHELQIVMQQPADAIPWTASREEVYLWDATMHSTRCLEGVTASLCMVDPAFARMLCEMLCAAGAQIVESDAMVLLVDVDPWSVERSRQLDAIVAEAAPQVTIAFSAWTTADLLADLVSLGIVGICPKLDPASLVDVIAKSLSVNRPSPASVGKSGLSLSKNARP